jgi:glycosyltransferase involved in cell wall biosynthesis
VKLVIQIPCLDEAETLPRTIEALPRSMAGIDEIAVVVVDDGSRDGTAAVAASLGAFVVRLPVTRGLASAFMAGIDTALERDADIIVNTDGDNQYRGNDIARLVAPLLAREAEIAIGARPIERIREFSWAKKALQRLGSRVLRWLTGTDVADATSGFRAYSREAALQLGVLSRYTYTLETIVHAAQSGMRIVSIPIGVNRVERPSRLARSTLQYVWRAGTDLVRMFVVYRPFRFFIVPAAVAIAIGAGLVARFLWLFMNSGGAAGHLQSLVAAAMLLGVGGALVVVALLGDLLAINRRLLQELRLESRRRRFTAADSRHGKWQ